MLLIPRGSGLRSWIADPGFFIFYCLIFGAAVERQSMIQKRKRTAQSAVPEAVIGTDLPSSGEAGEEAEGISGHTSSRQGRSGDRDSDGEEAEAEGISGHTSSRQGRSGDRDGDGDGEEEEEDSADHTSSLRDRSGKPPASPAEVHARQLRQRCRQTCSCCRQAPGLPGGKQFSSLRNSVYGTKSCCWG